MEPTNPNLNPAPAVPTPENPGVPEPQQAAVGSPEFQPGSNQGGPATPPPQLPVMQLPIAPGAPIQTPQPPARPAPAHGTPPPIAGDVDVIEKEWVDQAEKVIDKTKTDPYAEEEAVEELQADYLKKRYGHDLKRSNNE